MRNYKDLSPKEKFVRTCICFPVFLILLIVCPILLSSFVQFSTGYIVKFAIAFVIVIIVGIGQLISTYKAWKDHDDFY